MTSNPGVVATASSTPPPSSPSLQESTGLSEAIDCAPADFLDSKGRPQKEKTKKVGKAVFTCF